MAGLLRQASHVALLLDFDGTLAPLCRRPEQARATERTRALLRRLARHPRVTVSVISGRGLGDLRRRLSVPGVLRLGSHGWEDAGEKSLKPAERRALTQAKRLLVERLTPLAGVWIEEKGFAFAVHRGAATGRTAERAGALLRRTLRPFAGHLRVLEGHRIWEVLPRAIAGKGAAVRAQVAGLPRGALAIYVGDDAGDEPAFAALPNGVTVRVGAPRRTRARYRLRDPAEVRRFLEKLEGELA